MKEKMSMQKREHFGSKLGVLAAAVGSAIGLGNIWKFPYVTGQNGGAAFILVYLACIILIGLPVMLAEFVIGRKSDANAVEAFKKIKPKKPWYLTGVLAVSTAFIILSFYAVIAGWIFSYISRSITGKLIAIAPDQMASYFTGIISSNYEPMFWSLVVLGLTAFVVISGVKDGVEKYSKVLMPTLLLILFLLMLRSLTLDGASKGLEFLFKPDFSKLTAKAVLEALGHAFFSLSLGMGIVLTYGSYIDKRENVMLLALQVTAADTIIALMAGMVIFPAVFVYGFAPNSGAELIFITLPAVFQAMPFGGFFEALFFILVGIAAVTSTISLLEVVVSFFIENFHLERKKATILLVAAIFIVSVPSTLSFGAWSGFTIFGMTIFDTLDFMASNIFLPLGGVLVSLFVGWVWGTHNAVQEITSDGLYVFRWSKVFNFIIKYLAPVAIILILLYSTGLLKL